MDRVGHDDKKTRKRKSRRDKGLNNIERKVKSRNNFDAGVTSGSVKSDGPISESGQNANRSGGLISFSLSADGIGIAIRIPRKRRGTRVSAGITNHVPKPWRSSNSVDQTAHMNSDSKDCTSVKPNISQHAKNRREQLIVGKKRRGHIIIDKANSDDEGNVGDASSRKGQSRGKKRKCLPVDSLEVAEKAQPEVEFIERSLEDSIEDDVVSALLLLSSRPDPQCTVADRFPTSDKENVLFDCVDPGKLMLLIGSDGMLKLNLDLLPFKEFVTQLSLPVLPLLDFPFGSEISRFFRLSLLQQYGSIVSTWPRVYFEILFVDNEVGLRFFLFEGCLKQAVAFVFVVLTVFFDANKQRESVDLQIPVTSVRIKLSCTQDHRKQHVFSFYSFSKLKHSNWSHLESVFQKQCLFATRLPLAECTLRKIRAFESGRKLMCISSVSWQSSFEGTRRKSFENIIHIGLAKSDKENRRWLPSYNIKHGMLPFALTLNAAPLFFRVLHLKMLMESNIAACVRLRECPLTCSLKSPSTSDWIVANNCSGPQVFPEILEIHLAKSNVDGTSPGVQRASGCIATMSDGILFSPETVSRKSFWTTTRRNLDSSPLGEISPFWHGERTNVVRCGFADGPRKARTLVHYAMPSGSSEFSSGDKPPNQNGHPFRRIRRAIEKRTSDDSKGLQRNMVLLACDSNVLMTLGDRCWREFGARVALELADQIEWKLSVKFSGSTKYLHKVRHVFRPGSTNRYTHAMMWKGGNDWTLEFPDRSQWMLFKEMHEECYNRNIRAASVKNIPIPGVHLVEECEANTEKLPFTRSLRYFRQIENDIDMAMNPSKILYDMDSKDEKWISRNEKSFQAQETCRVVITDDHFEKIMDMLEKFAYAKQRDHFTVDELEKLMVGAVPSEVINSIYQHWQHKRKRNGMPLIRHLQPSSWERYHKKVHEWNQLTTKCNTTAACGSKVKAPLVEKPAMFAFRLKPRSLEVPNKGSKRRSQKKFHVAGHRHAIIGDQGRKSISFAVQADKASYPDCSPIYFSLNNDASDFDNHPKLYRNKSKKIGALMPRSDMHTPPSYNQRPRKRNWVQQQDMEFPDWPSQKRHQLELYPSQGYMQLGVRDIDEFRVREASGAAKHVSKIAMLKRQKAQRLFSKADLAIHMAVSALMTANAVKASYCASD